MSGKYGTEEITKAVKNVDEIFDDIVKARAEDSPGGRKITLGEVLGLVFSDTGKVIKIINASDLIIAQIKDLQSEEAPEVIAAFKQLYSPENPFIESGATKALEGGLKFKEAAEDFKKAKEWEKEHSGSAT